MRSFLRFIILSLALMLTQEGYSNVVYVDVTDQTLTVGQSANFDLTGDNRNDIGLTVTNGGGFVFGSFFRPTLNTGVTNQETLVSSGANVDKLNSGEFISSSSGTYVGGNAFNCFACIRWSANWFTSATDAYIGFRFTNDILGGGTTHYGWARVDVVVSANSIQSVTIKDFAYDDTPNTGIFAGDMGIVPVGAISVQGQGGATAINTIGGSLQMEATVSPANATNPTVTWSVNNPAIATIDPVTGILYAQSNGVVTVCATATDGSGVSGCTDITISNQFIPVTNVSIQGQGGATSVISGSTLQMEETITPSNATDPTVTWTVNNLTGSASINATTGVLTGGTIGDVEVIATANDGSGESDTIIITIDPILVTGVTVQGQGGATSVISGSTLQMLATIAPANASNTTVTWSVTNGTGSANINSSTGVLTGNSPGTVTVCATANDGSGVNDCITITIDPILVTGVTVQGQGGATDVLSGNNLQMEAFVAPANASNTTVTWSVTNGTGTANINPVTGILTGSNPGTVTVCATANDGTNEVGCVSIDILPVLITGITVQGQGGVTSVTSSNTLQMEAIIAPANATNQTVTWSINPLTGSASINPVTGLLTGINPGTVEVIATSTDGSGITGSAIIVIDPILVTGITVQGQGGATSVLISSNLQMEAIIAPANATNQTVTWSINPLSGNASINATTGILTGTNQGTVEVIATATDGSGITGSAIIVVNPVLVTGITVQGQGGATTVTSGNTLQMLATIAPANATNQTVTWSVVNGTGTASINATTGVLTGINPGTVDVCAAANDGSGISDCITITIDPILVTGITVQGQGGTTNVISGSTLQMLATIAPANATNQTVTWSVVNGTGTASINATTGVLTGINLGTVDVCATATDGSGISDCITITIDPQLVTGITVQGQGGATTVTSGNTLQMLATIVPANATNQTVTWTVVNGTGTASINATTGVLTGINPGTVDVCAAATDGSGISDCITITIDPQLVTGITVQGQGGATNITSGNTLQMLATIVPVNATNQTVTWSVVNGTGTASINTTTGLLTGINPGTVQVCATATDGSGVTDCITITIDPQLVTGITVQGQGAVANVVVNSTLQMEAIIAPLSATNQTVTWTVINGTGTASISTTGLLTGMTVGTVQVCATATDGSGISDCATITIDPQLVATIAVQGQGGATSVLTANTLQMEAIITPVNATNQTVTWSVIPGTGTASIDPVTGILTGGTAGTVTVIATANDGSGTTGSVMITVTATPILITDITVQGQGGATTVVLSNTLQMEALITPANATNQTVTWTVTPLTGTANINTAGLLTGTGLGTVRVKAEAQDGSGIADSTIIEVINAFVGVTGITVQGQGGVNNVISSSTLQMVATIAPANATNQTVTWSVTNGTGTASVDPITGIVTGGNVGTVDVCATATDGTGIVGCTTITVDPILVTSMTVQGQGGILNVAAGNNLQMEAVILPVNATDQTVTWSLTPLTGNASISASGILTGITPGTVDVCAVANDGSGVSDCAIITIDTVFVTGITVQGQGGTTNVDVGSTLQMEAVVNPNNATDPSVTWSVTPLTGDASISASGILTGITAGTVQVCAVSNDGTNINDCVVITVDAILVAGITVQGQGGATSVGNGTTLQMEALITPANATNQTVTWTVTPITGNASINSSGVLTGISVGTVQVCATATDGSGISDCVTISVTNNIILVTAITVQGQGGVTNLDIGNNLQMEALITPANASNQSVTWSVTPITGNASISTSGVLTGISDGVVAVCAVATDGSGVSDCVNITIDAVPVTAITVQGQGGVTNLDIGNNLQMEALITPANASNQSVTWTVTPLTGDASINGSGVLTGISVGTVQVCATATDGSGVSDCETITIDAVPVTAITVQGQGGLTNVAAGSTLQMEAIISPANATNSTVTWSVVNATGTANIDPVTGVLTGGNPGIVTVCATSTDGTNITDCVNITVDAILVTGITVQGQGGAGSVQEGGTLPMEAIIAPINATNPSVTWTVTPLTGDASINGSGILTGITAGTVQVCATSTDGTNITGCATITVTSGQILVSSILVQGQNGVSMVAAGNTLQMEAIITPVNATNPSVTWSVINGTGAANINPSTGILSGVSPGTVTVMAMANDGSGVSGTAIINVDGVLVTNLLVQGQNGATSVISGDNLQMIVSVLPTTASNPSVTWSINPITGTASINSVTGLLTGGNPGTVEVIATANDASGVTGTAIIEVIPVLATSMIVQGQGGVNTINTMGGSLQMEAIVLPSNVTTSTVTWSVDDPAIATISPAGVLTAQGDGVVTVTATTIDGSGVSGSTQIIVSNQSILVQTIDIYGQGGLTAITANGGTLQMIADILPANATNPNVAWSVNNPSVATIDQAGLLQAFTNGSVTVTATAQDGSGISGSAVIDVVNQGGSGAILVTNIDVTSASNTITTNSGTMQMFALVTPANASQTVTWSVSNNNIATVDANSGLLTAHNNGTVLVVATATDGSGVSGTKLITVTQQISVNEFDAPVQSVNVYPNPFTNYIVLDIELNKDALGTSLEVWDMTGRLVYQNNVDLLKGEQQIMLEEAQNWSGGLYLIHLNTGDQVISQKVIKSE